MKPIVFLDFDRTIFDTDQLYAWMGPNRFERILGLTSGEIAPPDFASYLYPDTMNFLKRVRLTHRIVILTYAVNVVLQRKKLRGSGIIPLIDDVIITQGGMNNLTGKGEEASKYLLRVGDPGWEHTFVDDSPQNIDEVKRKNPDIRCIRIDRVPLAQGLLHGALVVPDQVVVNLAELESIL